MASANNKENEMVEFKSHQIDFFNLKQLFEEENYSFSNINLLVKQLIDYEENQNEYEWLIGNVLIKYKKEIKKNHEIIEKIFFNLIKDKPEQLLHLLKINEKENVLNFSKFNLNNNKNFLKDFIGAIAYLPEEDKFLTYQNIFELFCDQLDWTIAEGLKITDIKVLNYRKSHLEKINEIIINREKKLIEKSINKQTKINNNKI